MCEFDTAYVRKVGFRYGLLVCAPVVLPFLILYVASVISYLSTRVSCAGIGGHVVVLFLLLGGWAMGGRVARRVVLDYAKHLHLYGSRRSARVLRTLPLFSSVFGWLKIEMFRDGSKSVRTWCFAQPRNARRFKTGDQIEVVEDRVRANLRKRQTRAWYPFWEASARGQGAPSQETACVCQRRDDATKTTLLDILIAFEHDLSRYERWCFGIGMGITYVTLIAIMVSLLPNIAMGVIVGLAVGAAAGGVCGGLVTALCRSVALRRCLEKFDTRFPEGTAERRLAMEMLSEQQVVTGGWTRLRNAIKRRGSTTTVKPA